MIKNVCMFWIKTLGFFIFADQKICTLNGWQSQCAAEKNQIARYIIRFNIVFSHIPVEVDDERNGFDSVVDKIENLVKKKSDAGHNVKFFKFWIFKFEIIFNSHQ